MNTAEVAFSTTHMTELKTIVSLLVKVKFQAPSFLLPAMAFCYTKCTIMKSLVIGT